MAIIYSSAGALWRLGIGGPGQEALAPDATGLLILGGGDTAGGSVTIYPEASAAMLLGGSITLLPVPSASERGTFILIGGPDVYNSGMTEALVCMGLAGRAVEWGFLQEGSDLDTADIEVITGEDGRAAGVVFRNQRTEVSITAVFSSAHPLPQRGDTIAWLGMDGTPLSARVLSRQRSYSTDGWSTVQIRATKWDGLP